MFATTRDFNTVGWFLVDQIELLNKLEYTEALNNSAKYHSLPIQKREGCPQSHIELALVRVGHTSSLAHAEQSRLRVFYVEGLIVEFSVVHGVTVLCSGYIEKNQRIRMTSFLNKLMNESVEYQI